MIKVSIIIPVYNSAKYLSDCLNSILEQDMLDIEIICINDGSTDESLKILYEYKSKDERIAVISFIENKGQAFARNCGLKIARGEYIGFVDSDDVLQYRALNISYDMGVKYNLDVLCFGVDFRYEADELKNVFTYKNSAEQTTLEVITGKEYFIYSMKKEKWCPSVWRRLWRREFLLKNNIFFQEDTIRHEDNYFSFLAFTLAKRVRGISDRLYIYRCRPGSTMTGGLTQKRFCGMFMSYLYELNIIRKMDIQKDDDYTRAIKDYIDMRIRNLRDYWRDLLLSGEDLSQITMPDGEPCLLFCSMFSGRYHFIKPVIKNNLVKRLQTKPIIIYGAGRVGKEVMDWLVDIGISWQYIAVSDEYYEINDNCKAIPISKLNYLAKEAIVLVAATEKFSGNMVKRLAEFGFEDYIVMT